MDLQKILALCSLHCTMLCTSLSFLVQDAFKCLVTTSTARVKASQNKLYVILGLSALEVILINHHFGLRNYWNYINLDAFIILNNYTY